MLDALAFGDRLHLHVSAAAGPQERLPGSLKAHGVTLDRLRPIAASMEDVFIALLAARRAAPTAPPTAAWNPPDA